MSDRLTCTQVRERELIERYAAGTLPDADAEALEAHAFECAQCWAEMQQAIELHAALVTAPAVAAVPHRAAFARRWFPALAAAAVLVAAVGGLWYVTYTPRDDQPILRGPGDEIAVSPAWQKDGGLRIEWSEVPGAFVYRVHVAAGDGRELAREATRPELLLTAGDLAGFDSVTLRVEAENAAGEVIGRSGLSDVSRPAP